jgi:MarR family transcriptional regulator, organic hydroperoxide resistance regulator
MKRVSISEFTVRLHALMLRLNQAVVQGERDAVGKGEITVPQFWALLFLHRAPGASLNEAATALGLRASSASGLFDRLVRRGYVRRSRSQEDRRRILLSLSDKGRAAVEASVRHHQERMETLFAALNAEERDRYLQLLEKVMGGVS